MENNIRPCECCGQPRPHPTEPGVWEYIDYFELEHYGSEAKWTRVKVFRDEDEDNVGLYLTPINPEEYWEGRDLDEIRDRRIWWPQNKMWRKVE